MKYSTWEQECMWKIWTEYQLTVDFNVCKLLIQNVCVHDTYTHAQHTHVRTVSMMYASLCFATWSLSYFTKSCSLISLTKRPISAYAYAYVCVFRVIGQVNFISVYLCHHTVRVYTKTWRKNQIFRESIPFHSDVDMCNREKTNVQKSWIFSKITKCDGKRGAVIELAVC